jgi:8-oxo-dGTP pyrophosphatase MutT (NUDIX family)
MRKFKRVEPTEQQTFGMKYKWTALIKNFQTEDGTTHEFTTIGADGERAGAVVALTPDKQVITLLQFRAGPERWMYELPGGGFYEKEDAEAAALRELAEETGYKPGTVEFLGNSCRDAYSNTTWYYYLALNCQPSDSGQNLDKEEDEQGAEMRLISIPELIKYAKHDQMTDPHAVLMAYDKLMELDTNG